MRILTSTARANMPLLRILILAAIVWIAFRLIKKVIGPAQATPKKPVDYEDMVTCAHCQVHLPRSDALTEHGKTYCCADHAKADQN